MKFITFLRNDAEHLGVLTADEKEFVDLSEAGIAPRMIDMIKGFDFLREPIARLIANGSRHSTSGLKLLAPIRTPSRNIFCIGKNYYEHATEFGSSGFDSGSVGGNEVPEYPIIFSKPPSAVVGPHAGIASALDPYSSVDYEAELAVIIGRSGRVAAADDPMSFIFGYTIINDVTSRELQKRHKQWLLGKGIDTFAPMGPCIVTADEIADIGAQTIQLWVNGELRQSASIGQLIFDIPTLIRTIGSSITLQTGDIIATGTPAGVGIGYKPPRYLVPGDRIRIEVPAIGILENNVL
ncbi:fumarylacetoacetate hydrolase family protein [Bradyrhizobium sp. INPA01-394B]|uniref:Fumarylacetoacetate hydrolase family protein n=1 Tax=Bradyrhizobium campsiandrae TaxID=1729892 RepID=A0ABR7U5B8_9BRAD|nr:fumarylacetoacetate hydrolase family protein [Bradyrhizobium campsiandrae]MBC9879917.1 fumarylacetoacetate hydrolase family protein [Bradyrhizobium campsiandrae]MBC9978602.1 fumarylacetoacetate hydrolase family protein [Bradyrhizobium campsiandrae]